MNRIWKCDRCGHETKEEDGEVILAEWLCIEGLRKDGHGACLGTVTTNETEGKQP